MGRDHDLPRDDLNPMVFFFAFLVIQLLEFMFIGFEGQGQLLELFGCSNDGPSAPGRPSRHDVFQRLLPRLCGVRAFPQACVSLARLTNKASYCNSHMV